MFLLGKWSTTTRLTKAKRLGFLPCLKAEHLQARTVKLSRKVNTDCQLKKKKKAEDPKEKKIGMPYMPYTIKPP